MAKYTVRDTRTGKKITFQWNGDTPPNQEDMQEVFNEAAKINPSPTQSTPQQPQTLGSTLRGVARTVAPYARPVLEMGGALGGGALAGGGTMGLGAVAGAGLGYAGGKQAADLIDQYAGLQNPKGIGQELMETAVDIPTGAAMEMGGGIAGKVLSPILKSSPVKFMAQKVDKLIDDGINKAIRPSVVNKMSPSGIKGYRKKAREAVKTIIENKNNVNLVDEFGNKTNKLPETLDEFNQSIQNTKSNLFEQYNKMAQGGEKFGKIVGVDEAIPELDKIINSKPMQRIAPDVVEFAIKRKNEVIAMGEKFSKYTTSEAQEAIKLYNQRLKTYYKSDNPNAETIAKIDAMLANVLRKNLDDVIEKAVVLNPKIKGSQSYQTLKTKYGALKEIEKDVNKRAIVDARKNSKGLLDFTDIFTAGDIVGGVLSGNVGRATKGFVGKGLAMIYKHVNNPNTIVKNMFSGAEKALSNPLTKEYLSKPIGRGAGYLYGKAFGPKPEDAKQVVDNAMGATATPAQAMSQPPQLSPTGKMSLQLYRDAQQAYLGGRYDEALTLFKQLTLEDPKRSIIYKKAIDQINSEKQGSKKYSMRGTNR